MCWRIATGALVLAVVVALPSSARDTETLLPAHRIASSEKGERFLLKMPFYLSGEKHPAIAKELGTTEANRTSGGALRSDQVSCNAAFLDALKLLQENARDAGGDALVGLVSTTKGKVFDDPRLFRCVAGTTVVHVGLRARMVKLAD